MSEEKESTCGKEKCPQWDNGKCPMQIETTWINEQKSQPKVINDCAPQRTVLMLMEMHNHIMGMKQYASQTRNMLNDLIEHTQNFMIKQKNSREHIEMIVDRIEDRQAKMLKEQRKERKKNDLPKLSSL